VRGEHCKFATFVKQIEIKKIKLALIHGPFILLKKEMPLFILRNVFAALFLSLISTLSNTSLSRVVVVWRGQ